MSCLFTVHLYSTSHCPSWSASWRGPQHGGGAGAGPKPETAVLSEISHILYLPTHPPLHVCSRLLDEDLSPSGCVQHRAQSSPSLSSALASRHCYDTANTLLHTMIISSCLFSGVCFKSSSQTHFTNRAPSLLLLFTIQIAALAPTVSFLYYSQVLTCHIKCSIQIQIKSNFLKSKVWTEHT